MLVLNPEYGGDGKDGGPLREVHVAGRRRFPRTGRRWT